MEYTRSVSIDTLSLLSTTYLANQASSLGQSGLKISKVILGAMSYGSPEWAGWVLDEEQSLPLLKHAYDVGINTWDTASPSSFQKSKMQNISFHFILMWSPPPQTGRRLLLRPLRRNHRQSHP